MIRIFALISFAVLSNAAACKTAVVGLDAHSASATHRTCLDENHGLPCATVVP